MWGLLGLGFAFWAVVVAGAGVGPSQGICFSGGRAFSQALDGDGGAAFVARQGSGDGVVHGGLLSMDC